MGVVDMIEDDKIVIERAMEIIEDLQYRINQFAVNNHEKLIIGYKEFDRKFHHGDQKWRVCPTFNLPLWTVQEGQVTLKYFKDYEDEEGYSARYTIVLKFSDLDNPADLFDRIMGDVYDQAVKMMAEYFRKQETIKAKALEEYQKYFGSENVKS